MLRFPYLPEPLGGPPPPSLPAGATVRWRPLLPVHIIGPTGQVRYFPRALFDPGADDTIFPMDLVPSLGVILMPETGQGVRWRGQRHPLRFAHVELELSDESSSVWRWPAIVGFSPAPIRYPLLGIAGCLQFFDVQFRGEDRTVELETNRSYPGTKT
jgi:hypothetical protein